MKKLYLLAVISFWGITVQAATAAKPKKTAGSTKGAGKVGMASSKASSSSPPSGSLNVMGGTSQVLGGSSSKTSINQNAYTVKPDDNSPSYLYYNSKSKFYLLSHMYWLSSSGYTTLVGPCKGEYSDKDLQKIKEGNLGTYKGNKFVPAGKPKFTKNGLVLNKNQKCVAQNLTSGVYKINQSTLREAIKKGTFAGQLLTSRLLVQEFFLGRLAVVMQAMENGTALGAGQKDFALLSKKVATGLKRTRYMRNGVEKATGNSSTINVQHSKTFSPVDFFTGALIVNNTKVGITVGENAVLGGGVGFLSVPSTTYMNNWTNANPTSSVGLPTCEPMTIGELGSHAGGKIAFTPSQDNRLMTISFAGKTYSPESFGKGAMARFFEDFGPWAVIIEVAAKQVPKVVGLVKMSVGDYSKYLNIDGSVAGIGSDFSLGDIINTPYSLYQDTYQKSKTGSGKRFVSEDYPISDWVAQGMFNGQLELSKYQTLARVDYIPAVYHRVKSKPGSTTYHKVLTPAKVEYPLFKPESVSLLRKHAPGPQVPQILAENSGIDWLFLRSLRVTKAILALAGITEKLLSALDKNGKSLFLQVLQNPDKDIVVHSSGQYSQAGAGAGAAVQVSGAAMISGFSTEESQAEVAQPKVSKKSKSHKKVKQVKPKLPKKGKSPVKAKVRKNSKSPMLKGDVLYIGRTDKYVPIILTVDAQQGSTQTTSHSAPNLSGLTAAQAYKKGYEAGKHMPKRTAHSSSTTHSSVKKPAARTSHSALNLSGLTATQAYKKGYEAGKHMPKRTVHSSSTTHSSVKKPAARASHSSANSDSTRHSNSVHNATFHPKNDPRILPSSQAGRRVTKRPSSQKGSGSTFKTSTVKSSGSGQLRRKDSSATRMNNTVNSSSSHVKRSGSSQRNSRAHFFSHRLNNQLKNQIK